MLAIIKSHIQIVRSLLSKHVLSRLLSWLIKLNIYLNGKFRAIFVP